MGIGKQGLSLIFVNRILYIKTLCCFLLIPQEIRHCGWGEGKGSWGAEMSWLQASLSPAITTKLFSAKIQIWKLGGGIPGSGLYCGRPLSRRDTPLFYSTFSMEKGKRPLLSALSGNYKAFPGPLLKSVYVSWRPHQHLWRSTNISIPSHSWYLDSPPETQTLSQKDNLPRSVLFLIGKDQVIAREIFQKNSIAKHKCKQPHFDWGWGIGMRKSSLKNPKEFTLD